MDCAGMAELADAQASGACGSNIVWVQVPLPALFFCQEAEPGTTPSEPYPVIHRPLSSGQTDSGTVAEILYIFQKTVDISFSVIYNSFCR